MATSHGADLGTLELPYSVIRNLTSPDEKANGVQTWFANINARDVIGISTQDNLRTYIAEHSPAKRNPVHRQIENTIRELPDRFINRNSGVTITCTDCEVDDTKKVARLVNASIINGAQTQGELKRYFESDGGEAADFMVRAEIVMEPLHDQIVEIAIARNTATAVKSVSQAGARGYLTELKASIERGLPGETIQMNETDAVGPNVLNTQSVLQMARLLMPETLANGARNLPYKQGGKCLADFASWASAKDKDPEARKLYDFTVAMAPVAVREYRRWESHDAWNGHRLHEYGKSSDKPHGGRPVRRDRLTGKVVWVAPGLLFPIISALSAFVAQRDGKWALEVPKSHFKEDELIRFAVQQFRSDSIHREVALMGRSESAYDALGIYTDTIASVLKQA
ncbi:MAG: AIPR family protein [Devosia nanyangense]|uniref:AIPR family protein n=1 Tax=Devosia nanyangense TaxID=1228055 RepID=A0A933KYM7_9HYPH|nr:AIPR family protein [Devosia nanyangense]